MFFFKKPFPLTKPQLYAINKSPFFRSRSFELALKGSQRAHTERSNNNKNIISIKNNSSKGAITSRTTTFKKYLGCDPEVSFSMFSNPNQ